MLEMSGDGHQVIQKYTVQDIGQDFCSLLPAPDCFKAGYLSRSAN